MIMVDEFDVQNFPKTKSLPLRLSALASKSTSFHCFALLIGCKSYMVMIIPPRYAVSDVIGRVKGMTASRLRKKFSWLSKVYWKENIVWSPGYFVSTVGIDEKKILKCVKWQESQGLGQAKLEF